MRFRTDNPTEYIALLKKPGRNLRAPRGGRYERSIFDGQITRSNKGPHDG
jgi:hypothetical protein